MQSVDAKTASVAMTRCGNAFRAYLPAQEIAEDKALLKVEGNGFAAFDYTHPGKTSLAVGQVRKLLVTPAFANPELLPNCYVVSPGEDALHSRLQSLRRLGEERSAGGRRHRHAGTWAPA